jgi:hypothetical protein
MSMLFAFLSSNSLELILLLFAQWISLLSMYVLKIERVTTTHQF